ncbi:MAG: quinol oxidase [Nitrospirae bacterium]|nr:quinol oxidase [Nitrospirota bacterium]
MQTLKILLLFLAIFSTAAAEEPGKKVFTAAAGPDGVQQVSMTGGEYFFDPNYIIVKVNVPVALAVRKEGGVVPHDIVMNSPEAGMNFKEPLGKDTKIIRFTPTKTGKYPFTCTQKFLFFRSHEARGMKGTIEVVE